MLMKNGFFHVVETSSIEEAKTYLILKNDYFVLIDSQQITSDISTMLLKQKDFLIFAESTDINTVALAAKLGVHRIMSYPFHARKLLERIHSFI
jgi:hypothetical protein